MNADLATKLKAGDTVKVDTGEILTIAKVTIVNISPVDNPLSYFELSKLVRSTLESLDQSKAFQTDLTAIKLKLSTALNAIPVLNVLVWFTNGKMKPHTALVDNQTKVVIKEPKKLIKHDPPRIPAAYYPSKH